MHIGLNQLKTGVQGAGGRKKMGGRREKENGREKVKGEKGTEKGENWRCRMEKGERYPCTPPPHPRTTLEMQRKQTSSGIHCKE